MSVRDIYTELIDMFFLLIHTILSFTSVFAIIVTVLRIKSLLTTPFIDKLKLLQYIAILISFTWYPFRKMIAVSYPSISNQIYLILLDDFLDTTILYYILSQTCMLVLFLHLSSLHCFITPRLVFKVAIYFYLFYLASMLLSDIIRFLFDDEKIEETVLRIEYGVISAYGLVLCIGEIAIGKMLEIKSQCARGKEMIVKNAFFIIMCSYSMFVTIGGVDPEKVIAEV